MRSAFDGIHRELVGYDGDGTRVVDVDGHFGSKMPHERLHLYRGNCPIVRHVLLFLSEV